MIFNRKKTSYFRNSMISLYGVALTILTLPTNVLLRKPIDSRRTGTESINVMPNLYYMDSNNEERDNWTGKLDFFLSALSYSVGLGNFF